MDPFFRAILFAVGAMAAFFLAVLAGAVAAKPSQIEGRARRAVSTLITVGVFVSLLLLDYTLTFK